MTGPELLSTIPQAQPWIPPPCPGSSVPKPWSWSLSCLGPSWVPYSSMTVGTGPPEDCQGARGLEPREGLHRSPRVSWVPGPILVLTHTMLVLCGPAMPWALTVALCARCMDVRPGIRVSGCPYGRGSKGPRASLSVGLRAL